MLVTHLAFFWGWRSSYNLTVLGSRKVLWKLVQHNFHLVHTTGRTRGKDIGTRSERLYEERQP